MSWLTELKDKAKERTISLVATLIVILLGVIWAAIPSEIWGKVSAATPKRVLWSAIGLLVLGLILETAYVAHLRRGSKLKHRFGVMWSKGLIAHCPSCSSGLTSYGQYQTGYMGSSWGFRCVKCSAHVFMSDDEGKNLELKEAKRLLQSADKRNTIDAYAIGEMEKKILVRLSKNSKYGCTAEDLAGFLQQHIERVNLALSEMEAQSYIYGVHVTLGTGAPSTYYLTDKARKYLRDKGFI